MLDEHFRVEGRRTWFETIDEMQAVLDTWLEGYNQRRPHQGRGMNGRTPAQVDGDEMRVTFVGHATFLIQTQGLNVLTDPVLLPEERSGNSVEHQVTSQLAMEAFTRALDDLDELSRSVVVLREVEQLSYDEICELLDVPLPTVKTRLLRARRLLSATLEDYRP